MLCRTVGSTGSDRGAGGASSDRGVKVFTLYTGSAGTSSDGHSNRTCSDDAASSTWSDGTPDGLSSSEGVGGSGSDEADSSMEYDDTKGTGSGTSIRDCGDGGNGDNRFGICISLAFAIRSSVVNSCVEVA